MLKSLIISHELFQDYSITVDLDRFENIRDLLEYTKKHLSSTLFLLNLTNLASIADNLHLHIHDVKFLSELRDRNESIIWVCASND